LRGKKSNITDFIIILFRQHYYLKKMEKNKIVTSLWFSTDGGNISKVIEYYNNIFGQYFQNGPIIPLGQTPSGNTEMCEVHIFGHKYSLLCTENEHHRFNDAVAFTINCDDQNEIDKYWNYFIKEGEEVQCGWCIDKYGLRWQVLPNNLGELMSKPNSFNVMMGQKKIVIQEYLK
jgi:predicted 3-demethylubiquinone-9 3-methyltransferase (glyoxalase superfamily)